MPRTIETRLNLRLAAEYLAMHLISDCEQNPRHLAHLVWMYSERPSRPSPVGEVERIIGAILTEELAHPTRAVLCDKVLAELELRREGWLADHERSVGADRRCVDHGVGALVAS